VAKLLGLPQPGGSTPLATLVNALAPLQLLIALDNAEQVVDAVAELAAALLAGAAQVRLLVTSQAPLKTAQESLYRLEPLALPPLDTEASADDNAGAGAGGIAGAGSDAEAAMAFGAVALFVQRAQALDRHFVLTDANVAQVVTLCRLLDGAPLAIELAAARLPHLGLAALVNALHQRLHLLTGGRRDAPQRQQTLRATLAWSHGLLSPTEQAVFRRLSVFVGSASLAGAQQVLADEAPGALDAWAVLDALGALVDRSLVDLVEGAGGPDDLPRYRLLVSARLYASEQLLAAGENEALARRHAQAVQAMLVQARDDLHSGRVLFGTWQQALDPDVGNGLAAVACALRHDEIAGALAMVPALSRQMSSRRQHECRTLWNTVAPLLLATPSEPPLPPVLVARAALEGGRFYNNSERGRALLGLAHSLAIRLGDDQTRYLALESIAFVAGARDERDAYREAMAQRQRLHDPRWSNYVLAEGGSASLWAFIQADDLDGAQADIERHAVLIRAAGMNDEIEQSNRVCLLSEAGRLDEAIELAEAMYARTAGQRNRDDQRGTLLCMTGDYLSKGWTAKARLSAADFWPMAKRFTMQAEWADCAAQLAALEQRPQDAVQLLGYAEASNAAQGKPRQPQGQRLAERVEQQALAAWGASADPQEVARMKARGALMPDADLFALGLAAASLAA
jgi:predicted ATPase